MRARALPYSPIFDGASSKALAPPRNLLLSRLMQRSTGRPEYIISHRPPPCAAAPMGIHSRPFSAPEQVPGWAWRQQPLRILPHKPQIHPQKGSIFTEIWAVHVLSHLQPASSASIVVGTHCGTNAAKWGEGLSSNSLSPLLGLTMIWLFFYWSHYSAAPAPRAHCAA